MNISQVEYFFFIRHCGADRIRLFTWITLWVKESKQLPAQFSVGHGCLKESVLLSQLLGAEVLWSSSHPMVVVKQMQESCISGPGEESLFIQVAEQAGRTKAKRDVWFNIKKKRRGCCVKKIFSSRLGREICLRVCLRVGDQNLGVNDQLLGWGLVWVQAIKGLRNSLDLIIGYHTTTSCCFTCGRYKRHTCTLWLTQSWVMATWLLYLR